MAQDVRQEFVVHFNDVPNEMHSEIRNFNRLVPLHIVGHSRKTFSQSKLIFRPFEKKNKTKRSLSYKKIHKRQNDRKG